jgi:hypothetical protein
LGLGEEVTDVFQQFILSLEVFIEHKTEELIR